jgi:hypothetical protein
MSIQWVFLGNRSKKKRRRRRRSILIVGMLKEKYLIQVQRMEKAKCQAKFEVFGKSD